MIPLLTLTLPCSETIAALTQTLHENGMKTAVSFNSNTVRVEKTAVSPPCPHHGHTGCDCQIVVLLIYGQDKQPATLVAHGQDGKTWVMLAASISQRQPALERRIRRAITASKGVRA